MKTSVRRVVRWVIPLVLSAAVVLVRAHTLPLGTAIVVAAAIEGTTLTLGGIQAWRAVRQIAQSRHAGADIWDALTDGIAVFVPRPLARIIALEPRIWASIFIWLFRRPRANATTFLYTADSVLGFLLVALLFSAPVEALLVTVLVPWGWLRLALAILEVYTIVWLLGYAASLAVLPHRLGVDHLSLHYGLLLDAHIPLTNMAAVQREHHPSPNGREGYFTDAARRELTLVIGGTTNVRLSLHQPQLFSGLLRPMPPVQTILLKVDEPDRFVAMIAAALGASPVSSSVAGEVRIPSKMGVE